MIDSPNTPELAPASHREVIDRWPSLAIFAADIGVTYDAAKQMRRRNSIPDEYRPLAITAAIAREIAGIDFELLTKTAPARARASAQVGA